MTLASTAARLLLPTLLPLLLLLPAVHAQQIGTATPEVHPKLPTQHCTTAGGCVARRTLLVADALSRDLHARDDPSVSCMSSNGTAGLDATLCPDAAACARNCALEGADYTGMGVLTAGGAVTLRLYVANGTTTTTGGATDASGASSRSTSKNSYQKTSPRLYLLAEGGRGYEMLRLAGQELTYDVDVSRLGCGANGALYLSEMDESGARSEGMNPAGATYGTGYCDAQCFNTSSFFNGVANLNSSGACCNEMDIWEANSVATAFTPHTCNQAGSFPCAGAECGRDNGVCDKSGCGNNPYSLGNQQFYGPGMTVDTSRPFTVITQFITSDNNSANGTLSEIRRRYVQDGKLIENAMVTNLSGKAVQMPGTVSGDFCEARNASDYLRLGGMQEMGRSLARGMVLVFSLWDSDGDFMNWLDSEGAGPCNATAGNPANIVANTPDLSVTFSNIRYGDIDSTYNKSALTAAHISTTNAETTKPSVAGTSFNTATIVLLGLGLVVSLILQST